MAAQRDMAADMEQRGKAPGTVVAEGAEPAGRADRVRWALLLAAIGVLALVVALHTIRLEAAPGWDPQEGYNLDLAWNLLHGRLRLFALTQAFAQHPPLFYAQLALSIRVFGYSIVAVRALAALYAVLTCAALLAFGWRMLGPGPALWAGVVFTAAPLFLANTRWGYSYAGLMLAGLLCLWAAWRYLERPSRGRLALAAGLAGLATLSDYEGVALVALVGLLALGARRRDVWLGLVVGLGLPLIGLMACFAAAPGVFASDLGDTFGRAAGGNVALQVVELLVNYYRFVTFDPWIVLGLVGLFLVRKAQTRVFLLGALAVLGVVALKVRVIGPSFHTAVPLIPLLALGAGVALDAAIRHLYGWVRAGVVRLFGAVAQREQAAPGSGQDADGGATIEGWRLVRGVVARRGPNVVAALVAFLAVVAPVAIALAGDVGGLATTFATRNDAALATDPAGARAAATYVLAHAQPGDVALGSPQVVWQLDQPDDTHGTAQPLYAADILQTVAYTGRAAAFYPAGLGRGRWAFDVSLGHARYVIVDNLVRRLAAPDEGLALAPVLAAVASWPVVYQRGEFTIYERPAIEAATGTDRGW